MTAPATRGARTARNAEETLRGMQGMLQDKPLNTHNTHRRTDRQS